MKKILFFILLFSSISICAQKHQVGLKASVNYSKVSPKLIQSNYLLRSTFGLVYSLKLNKKLRFGVEVLYEGRGNGAEFIWTDENAEILGEEMIKFQYNYVAVPVKFGLVVNEKSNTSVNIGIVPSVNIEFNVVRELLEPSVSFNEISSPNKFDIAGLIEIQTLIKGFDSSEIYTSAGFQYGIRPIYGDDYFSSGIRHMLAQLSLGYRFSI